MFKANRRPKFSKPKMIHLIWTGNCAHPEVLAGVLADLEDRRIVPPLAFAVVQVTTGSVETDPTCTKACLLQLATPSSRRNAHAG